MSGYSDMRVDVAKAKAAADPTEENKEEVKVAETTYGKTGPVSSPVAAAQQQPPKPENKVTDEDEGNFIKNSTEAVANAKPGDKVRRSSGEVVTIQQSDIDAAKAKLSGENKTISVDPPKTDTDTDTDNSTENNMPANEDEDASKAATEEIANKVGIDPAATTSEEGLEEIAESGAANAAFDNLKGQVTDKDGKPFDKSVFDGTIIGSGNKPEDGLAWYQQIAPVLTVLSVAATAIGLANGVFIPPVNFNKITNRDEAYNAYLDVITADQKDENITQNERDDIVSSLELKKGLEESYGDKAWDEATKARGDIAEAGSLAVQREGADQNLEAMAKEHGFNLETLDKEQQNTLAQMDKQGELDAYMAQVEQTFNLETIDANTKAQLAVLAKQSENDLEMARVMSDLEATLDARAIKALKDSGLDVNGYAQWMKGRGGRTAADTVREYIDTVGNTVSNTVGAVNPLK